MTRQLRFISKPMFKLQAERNTKLREKRRGRFFHFSPCPCGCTTTFGYGYINKWWLVTVRLMYMPIPKGLGDATGWHSSKRIDKLNRKWPQA